MQPWWQRGIIYHIYPRSFQDSNGDGVGDLQGIVQRLPYLKWLGVDAVWISPVYPSPMADFGYDVSDYRDIDPLFGTLADMDEVIATAHRHGIQVILDFVPNHTSDRHPWFQASRSSRDNPQRDWYIWREPAPDGGPPNNWLSRFGGGPAWEWDEETGQYYLHSFLKEQPDLNWRNREVRAAMLDHLRFWFARGVDGFRIDVAYRVMKSAAFTDNPPNPAWEEGMDPSQRVIERYTKNTPAVHQFNRWLRAVADEYEDKVLIGEMNLPLPELVKHYGQGDELHLPFNFRLVFAPWDAATVRGLVEQYERELPRFGWPNWVSSNHDQPRVGTRVGRAQARVAMMLLLTLRGTPTIYYGDELGMVNVPIPQEEVQDPWGRFVPELGRDPARTPMQWDASAHAGFCTPDVEPWLPAAPDFKQYNVAAEREDEKSMLALTRRLIALRRQSAALTQGSYRTLAAPEGMFAYARQEGDTHVVVALNFTATMQTWSVPPEVADVRPSISTLANVPRLQAGSLTLRPDEGVVLLEDQEG